MWFGKLSWAASPNTKWYSIEAQLSGPIQVQGKGRPFASGNGDTFLLFVFLADTNITLMFAIRYFAEDACL